MSSERAVLLSGSIALAIAALGGCARFDRGQPSAHEPRDGGASGDAAAPMNGEALSFAQDVYPILSAVCGRCHGPGGAQTDAFALGDDADSAFDRVLDLSDADDPDASTLLRRASGNGHVRVIAVDSPDYTTIAAWMAGGEQP